LRGRVMLPIQDQRGRIIAFGGRILEPREGVAKYLNSPDTPLFDKGRTLYNHHRAATASRKSGRVVVVEGYMDVIALAEAGITDAVAPLGTALTEMQLELLWRMVEVPVLCFDGDAAGRRAAMRAVERALPMLGPMRSLSIVSLPEGLDPDDLIKQRGAAAMRKILAEPASLLDFLWQFERDAQPLASPEAKAGLKARLMEHINRIQDGDVRALYRRELLDRFSAFAYPVRERWNARGGRPRPGMAAAPQRLSREASRTLQAIASGTQRSSLLGAVCAGFLRHPGEIERHLEALTGLAGLDKSTAPAIESLIELSETLDLHTADAIFAAEGLPAPPDDLRYAFLREGTPPGEAREELAEAVSLLAQKPALEAAMAATIARSDEDPEWSFAEQLRLHEQIKAVDERLKAFGRKKAASSTN